MKGYPQLERGYTRIANELLEALMKVYLSNYERRVLDCIIRYTYGFQKKKTNLSLTFISKATGIPLSHVSRTKKKLLEKNIVTQIGNNQLSLQKQYKKWVTQIGNHRLPKQVTKEKRASQRAKAKKVTQTGKLPKQVSKVTQIGKKKLPKQGGNKENINKTYKYIYRSLKYLDNLPLEDIEEFEKKFELTSNEIKTKAAELKDYCLAKGRRYKDYKAFLRNALRKEYLKLLERRKNDWRTYIPEG